MQNGRVTVGLIQTTVSEEPRINLGRTIIKAEGAIARGAGIICLQELYRTRYFPQWERRDVSALAETIPGESTEVFSSLAKKHGVTMIVPVFEKDEAGFYNSVAVIEGDGNLLETYRKIHIPHDPHFYEKDYFQPGQEVRVYDTDQAKFAVLICYDQWFPETARVAALKGAEIIFYPTAIGWIRGMEDPSEGDWRDAWETVQRGHAIVNGVHVAAVNRVGREEDLLFWGSSFICDSFGKILVKASDTEEEVLVAELDLSKNEEVREGWGFFRNRRPETYWPLVELDLQPPGPEKGMGEAAADGAGVTSTGKPKTLLRTDATPLALGYRMPAEWEKHEAVWLSWPYDLESFPEIEKVEEAYISLIRAIHQSEIVNLLVRDDPIMSRVLAMLEKAGVDLSRIRFHTIDYADVWFRDYGPTFVVNREKRKLAMVAWIFNAWGEKYAGLIEDAKI
ncbi:MAG TPA: nitrilase-related carbon-nitrogen hydrolase, partial [Methanothrix sp.]|nr:nitrilase-related carbon-nitrogen hydrolase [Methanothrix sp.]